MKGKGAWTRRRAIGRRGAVLAVVLVFLVAGLAAYVAFISPPSSPPSCTSTGSPASTSSAIKIGYLAELSGSSVSNGYAARIGAEIAVNQTNAAGGVDGRTIDLVISDSETNPQVASQCAATLDQQDGVLAITGPTDQSDAVAVQAYAEAHQVPFVVSAVSSGAFAAPDSNWTVSVQPDAVQWGAAMAKYVSEAVPSARIALMTQNAGQQKEMAAGVNWYASTYKNESIVFNEVFSNAQFPWATAAAAAKLSGANAVVVSWISAAGFSQSNVIQALLSAGFQQSQIFVVSATNQISDLGTSATGIRGVTVFDGALAQGYPNASAFVDEMQPYVNGQLGSNSYCGVCPMEIGPVYYYSYLGMKMMINAIQGILSSGQQLTRAAFMSSMRHASIQDAFGNELSIGTAGSSVGTYYVVEVGPPTASGSTYALNLIKSIGFAPGTVPSYELAKTV